LRPSVNPFEPRNQWSKLIEFLGHFQDRALGTSKTFGHFQGLESGPPKAPPFPHFDAIFLVRDDWNPSEKSGYGVSCLIVPSFPLFVSFTSRFAFLRMASRVLNALSANKKQKQQPVKKLKTARPA